MTRLLKINGVGCLIALIVSAILVVLNWDRITFVVRNLGAMFDGVEAAETLRSVDALLDFIDANRSHVSLVAYRLDDPDSAILLNPDVPRPLASTTKILVLPAMCRPWTKVGGHLTSGCRSPLSRPFSCLAPTAASPCRHSCTCRLPSSSGARRRDETWEGTSEDFGVYGSGTFG